MDAYREDLAFVHESGYTFLAEGAAQLLLAELDGQGLTSGQVVEFGCGGGTLARIVCNAGFSLRGYDISEAMIATARARVPEATFFVQSFVDVEIPSCAAVVAIGEIINYLFDDRNSHEVLQDFLRRIFDALQPGGVFIFDFAGPDRAPSETRQAFREHEDWTVLVTTSSADMILDRGITVFRRIGDVYRRDYELHRLRLIDPGWVASELAQIGFDAQSLDRYHETSLLEGLHAFSARKPPSTRG